jgi:mannose-6-phosphate isomerase-like protein (cupin superfamily)
MSDPLHETRPWGEFRVLERGAGFQVKRIDVKPGGRLSYQRHARRHEHWVVVAGRARVTLDGSQLELGPGDTSEVPVGAAHRVENPGSELLTFIEVQRGEYLGEDDIERLADDYGRVD